MFLVSSDAGRLVWKFQLIVLQGEVGGGVGGRPDRTQKGLRTWGAGIRDSCPSPPSPPVCQILGGKDWNVLQSDAGHTALLMSQVGRCVPKEVGGQVISESPATLVGRVEWNHL